MPHIMESPVNVLTGVDYFKAKLQCETTPELLHSNLTLPSMLVLDVRGQESFLQEHIRGAVNIPFDQLPRRYRELPKDKTIVCYAERLTSFSAPKAALELAHRGYKVQELLGGIEQWKKEGFETEGEAAGARRGEAQY